MKWLSAFIVGLQYTEQLQTIINQLYDLFASKREERWIKDGDGLQIEDKLKRELPSQCQRHLYRDATGQLRSIVFCRSVNG